MAVELLTGAEPGEASPALITLANVCPEESGVVVVEVLVGVLCRGTLESVEFSEISLVTIVSKAARVARALGIRLSKVLEHDRGSLFPSNLC